MLYPVSSESIIYSRFFFFSYTNFFELKTYSNDMYPSFPSFTSILVFIKYLTLLWAELTLLMDQHEIQIGCDILFFVWTNQSGCGRCHSREERKYVFISFFFFVVGFLSFFDDLKECHTNTLDLNWLTECRVRLFHYTWRRAVKIHFLWESQKSPGKSYRYTTVQRE